MKIEFYIPDGQVIPTNLRLKIDDKYDVYYEHAPNEFAWLFTFWNRPSVDDCTEILNEIIRKMIWQSQDHDARWVETDRVVVNEPEGWWDSLTIKVSFRVRDAG